MEDVKDDIATDSEHFECMCLRGLCTKLKYPVRVANLLCEKWLGIVPLSTPNGCPGNQMTQMI
eukprot:11665293-Ditylum_brightwellii.AAC.1